MKRYALSPFHSIAVAILLALMHLSGCATDPGPAPLPPWVREPPVPSDDERLIVGYGVGATDTDALHAAGLDVRDQISRILLERYDPENQGLPDHAAWEIERIADERREHLEPLDDHRSVRGDGWVEQYLLVAYGDQEVLEDLSLVAKGVAELLRESSEDDPVTETPSPVDPLRRLRTLIASTPPSSPAMRNQTLLEARELARRVRMSAQPGDIEVPLGRMIDEVVVVRLLDETGDNGNRERTRGPHRTYQDHPYRRSPG